MPAPGISPGYTCSICGAYIGNFQVHNCPGYRIYPGTTPTPPAPVIPPLKGWECPKCGAVMAHWVASCVNCKGNKDG